jgi:hypothetical protein
MPGSSGDPAAKSHFVDSRPSRLAASAAALCRIEHRCPAGVIGGGATLLLVLTGLKVFTEFAGRESGLSTSAPSPEVVAARIGPPGR